MNPKAIEQYFDYELTDGQKNCLKKLVTFFNDSSAKVFILKGYAGTGKTTLLKGITKYLSEIGRNYSLHATTGRAAKVASNLSDKKVSTLHSLIYKFNDLGEDLDAVMKMQSDYSVDDSGQISLIFKLNPVVSDAEIFYFIDESSMISDVIHQGSSNAKFGSGELLTDLFKFDIKGKFVFIGDPCQLPPISQKESPALNEKHLKNKFGFKTFEFELIEPTRTSIKSGISRVSFSLRKLYLNPPQSKWATYPLNNAENVKKYNSHIELMYSYFSEIHKGNIEQSILICQTNKHCLSVNKWIRSSLKRDSNKIEIGDVLMVTQNNYLQPLVNGDQVLVKEIGTLEIRCGLRFRKIIVEEFFSNNEYSCLIIEDVAFSSRTNLDASEHKAIFLDFYKRMQEKGVYQKDAAFKDHMLTDPYLNALRAVFGYAITCHKSQGGEWDKVYLYMDNKVHGIPKPGIYQWWYTATTRAKQELHIVSDWFIM